MGIERQDVLQDLASCKERARIPEGNFGTRVITVLDGNLRGSRKIGCERNQRTVHVIKSSRSDVVNAEKFGEPVNVELKAGKIYSHLLLNGSKANESEKRRCGLTLRYCAAVALRGRRLTEHLWAADSHLLILPVRQSGNSSGAGEIDRKPLSVRTDINNRVPLPRQWLALDSPAKANSPRSA